MPEQEKLFIRLGDDEENAPKLKYSIPDPNSYFFRNIIAIDVPENYFIANKIKTDDRSTESSNANTELIDALVKENVYTREDIYDQMKAEEAARTVRGELGDLIPIGTNPGPYPGPIYERRSIAQTYPSRSETRFYEMLINGDNVNSRKSPRPWYSLSFLFRGSRAIENSAKDIFFKSGGQLYFTEGIYGINSVRAVPSKNTTVKPQLLIIESYQLSNYRGNYGAGRVIKTHSLAPGEKNKFSVKTYKKTTETKNEGSSILDSNTREAASDFEESFERESTNKRDTLTADLKNSERAEASASVLGIGGGGEYEKTGQWGTRSTRETFAKTVGKAVEKHSYRASSKRDIQVNFSSQSTYEEGEETSLEREIENINVSRTLNFVFRQMIQEFISVLHLIDMKIAIYDGTQGPYVEYSFYELDKMFDDYFINDNVIREEIKLKILREFYYIFDYKGEARQLLEKVTDFTIPNEAPPELDFGNGLEYWRIKYPLDSEIEDLPEGIKIPGIVTGINKITMRTEGIIMDAFLGLGDALDIYSHGLQDEEVRSKKLSNDLKEKEITKTEIANNLVQNGDETKVDYYSKIFPCCPERVCCCENHSRTEKIIEDARQE